MTVKRNQEDQKQIERDHSVFVDQFMLELPVRVFDRMNDASIQLQDASYELGRQRGLQEAGAAAEEFRISSDIHQANRELAEQQHAKAIELLKELHCGFYGMEVFQICDQIDAFLTEHKPVSNGDQA